MEELYKKTLLEIEKLHIEYDMGEVPSERFLLKAQKVLHAQDKAMAESLSKSAISSAQVYCILHGTKRSPEWYDKQARDCARRAKMFESKGEPDKAKKQLEYQARYEESARQVRATK